MKALTIRQPYAYLIVTGEKPVENRSWSTNYRGPLLIHAAVKPHEHSIEQIQIAYRVAINRDRLRFGGVIGCVDLVNVVTAYPSRWFQGPFGFVLENPRMLPFAPARGYQGLFEIDL